MTLLELADNIHRDYELTITPAAVVLWLRSHIGDLNNLIDTNYVIEPTNGTVSPALDLESASILQCLYLIHHYDVKLRSTTGAAGIEQVLEVTQDGHTIRLLNKTELSKVYLSAKKDETMRLNNLVASYKLSSVDPQAVHGQDTTEGS